MIDRFSPKDRQVVEAATRNLDYANAKLRSTAPETIKRPTNLAKRTYFKVGSVTVGNGIGLGLIWPEFPTSRIYADQNGVSIWHKEDAQQFAFYTGKFIEAPLTTELIVDMWSKGQARSLIRSFAQIDFNKIDNKLSKTS
ncbi:MAG TPA: hypothetical protein VLE91_03300 [Candidatus Saccharimonadales bacterium]|nr:hypothetical protein [Candidatus Saccharimonadales bacterium]